MAKLKRVFRFIIMSPASVSPALPVVATVYPIACESPDPVHRISSHRIASSLAKMCKKATCDTCGQSASTFASLSLSAVSNVSTRRQAILVGMWQCIYAAICLRDEQLLTFTTQAHSSYHGLHPPARQMHVRPKNPRRG